MSDILTKAARESLLPYELDMFDALFPAGSAAAQHFYWCILKRLRTVSAEMVEVAYGPYLNEPVDRIRREALADVLSLVGAEHIAHAGSGL